MIAQKILNQQNQFWKSPRSRKQNLLFRRKMNPDFTLKVLRDFCLPSWQTGVTHR
jgi:hypothetical protein